MPIIDIDFYAQQTKKVFQLKNDYIKKKLRASFHIVSLLKEKLDELLYPLKLKII